MKLTSRTGADAHFSFTRKTTEIAAEAASDGIYVVRISLPAAAANFGDLRLRSSASQCGALPHVEHAGSRR